MEEGKFTGAHKKKSQKIGGKRELVGIRRWVSVYIARSSNISILALKRNRESLIVQGNLMTRYAHSPEKLEKHDQFAAEIW